MEAHCENCGRANPDTSEGYTACCNELVCDGLARQRWAIGTFAKVGFDHTKTGEITACCSARGQATLPAGLEVLWREN